MSLADDLLTSSNSKSKFLSPNQRPKTRKSTASLHDEGRFSLAHELAHALMPEPTAGSKLLAEEFGIEYDEGAEGIDEPSSHVVVSAEKEDMLQEDIQFGQPATTDEIDPTFGEAGDSQSPTFERPAKKKRDAMQTLERDLDNTNRFLSQLRSVDVASSSSSIHSPTASSHALPGNLEQLASSIIQKLNSSAQDRESQVRELLNYEREFRKLSGDVLGSLDELTIEVEPPTSSSSHRQELSMVEEEDPPNHRRGISQDWDADPHPDRLEEDDDEYDSDSSEPQSPTKPPTPPPKLPPGGDSFAPAHALPHLTYFRSTTTSLVSSLSSISEQVQINSVFTTEAGRKIRALRGKLGEWKDEYDEVEKSKVRVGEWERDEVKGRGKKMVQEELEAFQKVLGETEEKTKVIMAAT
ncbi:hypothetical protein DL96DRAFT_1687976 [Flagelloscypha sp. PMI_526]|nr:hypothetical protein DL96DRAFT_1687976 [Flagelloscypha sp. PMI_526]